MLTKNSLCSDSFAITEKCRRLAIGCRICGNEQSYENKKRKKGKKSFSCTESPCPLYIFHSFFYSHYPPQYLFHVALRLVCSVSVSILAVINSISPFITFDTSFSIFSIYSIPSFCIKQFTSHDGHNKYEHK